MARTRRCQRVVRCRVKGAGISDRLTNILPEDEGMKVIVSELDKIRKKLPKIDEGDIDEVEHDEPTSKYLCKERLPKYYRKP